MKSLQVVISSPGDLCIKENEMSPTKEDEILCKVHCSLISIGTELMYLNGQFSKDSVYSRMVKYPFFPGYSSSAEVLEVGSKVKGIKPKDHVFIRVPHAQYVKTTAKHVYPVPNGISFEQAAFTQNAIMAQLAVRRAELKLGDSVGVLGLGVIGQLIIQYLKNMGLKHIVAIGQNEKRLALAKQAGATEIIHRDDKCRNAVRMVTNGQNLDTVFDVTGHPSTLSFGNHLVKRLGQIILVGDHANPSEQSVGPLVIDKSISIHGIHAHMAVTGFMGWDMSSMSELYYRFLADGRLDIDPFISHRIRPDQISDMYKRLEQDRSDAIGVLIDWH